MQDSNYKIQFTRLNNPDGTDTFAFYTLIAGDPDKRAYLEPVINQKEIGERSKMVRAIMSGRSADGKYYFSIRKFEEPSPAP